jgi:AraC-like DNA-binding protein
MKGIGIESLPYLIGAVLFLLLAVKLVTQASPFETGKANVVLAILCLVFFMIEVDEFIMVNGIKIAHYWVFESIQNAAHLLLGPLSYLYLTAMSARHKLKHFSFIHLWAFGLGLILMAVPFNEIVTLRLFVILYLSSLLPYVYACYRGLKKFDSDAKRHFSNLTNHNLNGLKVWVYMMLFISAYVLLSPVYQWLFERQHSPLDIQYLLALFAAYLLVSSDFTVQKSLSDLPYLVDLSSDFVAKETLNEDITATAVRCSSAKNQMVLGARLASSPSDDPLMQQNKQSSLDDAYDDVMDENQLTFNALDNVVKTSKLYLKNGLSLADLAQVSGYSSNQVSALINQGNDACFYDYVNRYRIDEAKLILVHSPSKAIIDVAMASGFNSKSAFYKAFAKQGIGTPSEFRRQQIKRSLTGQKG